MVGAEGVSGWIDAASPDKWPVLHDTRHCSPTEAGLQRASHASHTLH